MTWAKLEGPATVYAMLFFVYIPIVAKDAQTHGIMEASRSGS